MNQLPTKAQFSYIYPRRPAVGQLVRNRGAGNQISRVVAVEGQYYWAKGIGCTNEGNWRPHIGRVKRFKWEYCKSEIVRRRTPADVQAWDDWRATIGPDGGPSPKWATGKIIRRTKGTWVSYWHRPVKRNNT